MSATFLPKYDKPTVVLAFLTLCKRLSSIAIRELYDSLTLDDKALRDFHRHHVSSPSQLALLSTIRSFRYEGVLSLYPGDEMPYGNLQSLFWLMQRFTAETVAIFADVHAFEQHVSLGGVLLASIRVDCLASLSLKVGSTPMKEWILLLSAAASTLEQLAMGQVIDTLEVNAAEQELSVLRRLRVLSIDDIRYDSIQVSPQASSTCVVARIFASAIQLSDLRIGAYNPISAACVLRAVGGQLRTLEFSTFLTLPAILPAGEWLSFRTALVPSDALCKSLRELRLGYFGGTGSLAWFRNLPTSLVRLAFLSPPPNVLYDLIEHPEFRNFLPQLEEVSFFLDLDDLPLPVRYHAFEEKCRAEGIRIRPVKPPGHSRWKSADS